jgi:hypothetical protein
MLTTEGLIVPFRARRSPPGARRHRPVRAGTVRRGSAGHTFTTNGPVCGGPGARTVLSVLRGVLVVCAILYARFFRWEAR